MGTLGIFQQNRLFIGDSFFNFSKSENNTLNEQQENLAVARTYGRA